MLDMTVESMVGRELTDESSSGLCPWNYQKVNGTLKWQKNTELIDKIKQNFRDIFMQKRPKRKTMGQDSVQ